MAAMETLSEAITRLVDAGYVHDFRPVGHQLVCGRCEARFDPAEMTVDEVVRFEGVSDPDDQAILFALGSGPGQRGVFSSAYGVGASSADIAILLALQNAVNHPRRAGLRSR